VNFIIKNTRQKGQVLLNKLGETSTAKRKKEKQNPTSGLVTYSSIDKKKKNPGTL